MVKLAFISYRGYEHDPLKNKHSWASGCTIHGYQDGSWYTNCWYQDSYNFDRTRVEWLRNQFTWMIILLSNSDHPTQ